MDRQIDRWINGCMCELMVIGRQTDGSSPIHKLWITSCKRVTVILSEILVQFVHTNF